MRRASARRLDIAASDVERLDGELARAEVWRDQAWERLVAAAAGAEAARMVECARDCKG